MGLADRRIKPDNRTKFEKWLDSLNAKNRATVDGWLTDTTVKPSQLYRWLRDDDEEDGFVGYPADAETITTWRRDHGVG